MKRLVLLGEGDGEVLALPILVRRILNEKAAWDTLSLDDHVIRSPASQLVKYSKQDRREDWSSWTARVKLAGRRAAGGGVLAIFDGDFKKFPPGSDSPFCAVNVAKSMAKAARNEGAGHTFSLCIVFACSEYETWLIAGIESLAGRLCKDRIIIPKHIKSPAGNPESHGKGWIEKNSEGYRPSRDQAVLTELVDLRYIREKGLRSFIRFESALDQLLNALKTDCHISTPA